MGEIWLKIVEERYSPERKQYKSGTVRNESGTSPVQSGTLHRFKRISIFLFLFWRWPLQQIAGLLSHPLQLR